MTQYIGIPFLTHGRTYYGCDCWGIVCLYYRERGIELPPLTGYADTKDADTISNIIDGQKAEWVRTDQPQEGDVIVFRLAGKETHVGIYWAKGRFLHVIRGINSCIEKLNSPKWKNRIAGVYRYAG